VGALILSLTYVPMASALFLSKKIDHKVTIADRIMNAMFSRYKPMVDWAFRKPKVVITASSVLLMGSIGLFTTLGGEFIPELNEGDFAVEVVLPTNASLSQSIHVNTEAQKLLMKQFPDEIKQVVSRIGASEIPTDPMGINACDLLIILKEPKEWKKASSPEELEAKMDEALNAFPEVNFEFTQPIQMRFNELIAGVKSDIAIKIFGEDLGLLFEHATDAARHIRKVEGVGDIKVQQIDGIPQLVVKFNRAKLAQYGLNVQAINQLVKTTFAGETAGIVMEGEKRFDLVVRMDSVHRQDIQNLRELYIELPSGGQIPLQEVAEVDFENAPVEVSRDATHRRITIGINVRNRDVESVVADIQKVMKEKVVLPAGYYVTYGGTFENLQAAKSRLALVVPIALVLIFVLLFFTFQSFLEASIIYLAIPLSAIGGIWALWLRGMPFSVSAGIGFIALFGVAVLNGIVLLSFFKQLANEGLSVQERLEKGLALRFRPVIMTAAVASLGFLPMALSTSPGAEVQRPLATVVIGGLITATFLTLVVIPVVYSILMGRKERKAGKNALLILLILGLGLTRVQAQTPKLSLNQCVSEALQKNSLIRSGGLEIQTADALIATGRELPKGTLDFQYGKTQTYFSQDYTIIANQSIPWPTLLKAQVKALSSQKMLAEKRLAMTKSLVAASVKWYYYQLLVQQKQATFLKQQDSLYVQMRRAASLKYKEGETGKLEFVAAEARLREFQQKQAALSLDIKANYAQLSYWTNHPTPFEIQGDEAITMNLQKGKDIASMPAIQLFDEQIQQGKLLTDVERHKLLPDIRVGAVTQSIENNAGQNFIQAGISIPLFAKAQKARIKAAESNELLLASQKEQGIAQLSAELSSQFVRLEKHLNGINYYQQTGLAQAAWLELTALKSYQQGEIEYVEMLQNTQQAWQIREQYLQEVLAYNQSIVQIETILGNE
jgi:cobalt-zinc-cadmium resistance protein CzcA